jgi:hypothetical protein
MVQELETMPPGDVDDATVALEDKKAKADIILYFGHFSHGS